MPRVGDDEIQKGGVSRIISQNTWNQPQNAKTPQHTDFLQDIHGFNILKVSRVFIRGMAFMRGNNYGTSL